MSSKLYANLLNALSCVRMRKWDYAIVTIHDSRFSEDCYIQFTGRGTSLRVEAASHHSIPEIGDKTAHFKKNGYRLDNPDGNFIKEYDRVSDADVIAEMKYIFERIYDIPFQNWTIDYIESEFYETRAVEQEMSEEAMQKRDGYKIARYALIAAIVLAAILYILCWA